MKARLIINIVTFLGLLVSLTLLFFLLPDMEVSYSERRKLAQLQTYSQQQAAHGGDYPLTQYFADLEKYALDQFPGRDTFRSLKTVFQHYALGQKDVNGYYLANGHLSRLDPELNENAVNDAVSRFNAIYQQVFRPIGANAYFALIPDKNYYLAEPNGMPHYDYEALCQKVEAGLDSTISWIPIRDSMSLANYYRTDPHWDQSTLLPIADLLLEAMGAENASSRDWTTHTLTGFSGTYLGQAALPILPDSMSWLTCQAADNASVTDHTGSSIPMYDTDSFTNVDPYDLFLHGAVPLLTLRDHVQDNGRQLVVLRDSFGSSMVPLLLPSYSEVVVIDIRYMSPRMLTTLLLKPGCDLLFLYSTSVLNTYGVFLD